MRPFRSAADQCHPHRVHAGDEPPYREWPPEPVGNEAAHDKSNAAASRDKGNADRHQRQVPDAVHEGRKPDGRADVDIVDAADVVHEQMEQAAGQRTTQQQGGLGSIVSSIERMRS